MDDLRSTITNLTESLVRIVESGELVTGICYLVALAWCIGVTISLLWRVVEWLSRPWPKPVPPSPPPKSREEQLQESLAEITQEFDVDRDAMSQVELEGQEAFFVETALKRKMMQRLFDLFGIREDGE